ncbi:MAG: flagellar biosynthesis protein FlhF [Moraxellaceae bacterium]|nr:flagellar biosynthesis protein FlhF [Moraxellaceae bacterium]
MVNVKRYVAKTAREALVRVKAELGADAVVLSNRAVDDGVEIVAMPATAMGELNATVKQARNQAADAAAAAQAAAQAATHAANQAASQARRAPAPAQPPAGEQGDDFTVTLGQHIARLAREQKINDAERQTFRSGLAASRGEAVSDSPLVRGLEAARRREEDTEPEPDFRRVRAQHQIPGLRTLPPEQVVHASATTQDPAQQARVVALEATNAQLMDELSSIKGLLERQLAGFAWSEISRTAPARTQMMGELLEAGFSPELTRQITEQLAGEVPVTEARKAVRQALNRSLRAVSNDADIIDRGGVYALVGPTGVGKTTTTAKLAARCVMRHGADKLALITTDGYRIGAHEQLRIYGRILGVQVHVVRDAADLRQTLQSLRDKHIVLIDTIGVGQRDKMVDDQAAMLRSAGNVRRLLLLNAAASGETLDDVLRAYEGPDLAGCILSKVDEAVSLAPVIDVAARHELDVFYVANGQRVPEDLHLPNRTYLIHRALREIPADSPYKLDDAAAAMLMASRARRQGDRQQRGAA